MAGHSKWANIKHRKEIKDTKKAQIYTKLIKEIIVATKQAGPIPANNARLRLAIQNAKRANLPKENIMRAIKKASGDKNTNYLPGYYEGSAPHSVAIIVTTMSDNSNRTIASVRAVFNKHGGNMTKNGSITHLFAHKGTFLVSSIPDKEATMLALIDVGVETFEQIGEFFYLTCPVKNFGIVQKTLEAEQIPIQKGRLTYLPHTIVQLTEAGSIKVKKLIEALESLDDVQHVYHNLAIEDTKAQS